MSLFCRHNRLTASCPICSKEAPAERRHAAPPARARTRQPGQEPARRTRRSAARGSGAVVTRRLVRSADDGYRNDLVPGLRATADARRLAAALTAAAARLEPPGPHPAVAEEPDLEQATWLAFLGVLVPDGPEAAEALATRWGSGALPPLPPAAERTARAYRQWAGRAGSQAAGFTGDPDWTPRRRFARVHERLALPGFGRAPRFELLVILGAAGRYDLEADSLHLGKEDDATELAAKRLLVSGDVPLLERRAAELAAAGEVPLAALDHGLRVWGTPDAAVDAEAEPSPALRRALHLG